MRMLERVKTYDDYYDDIPILYTLFDNKDEI